MPVEVLAFRHVPFEHLGLIADSLSSRGIACRYADLADGDPGGLDLHKAAALIVMGGPMSANDDLPYLRRELDLIAEAVSLGKPVLGVCLGSQLIAKALGARVYANAVREIGWYPVEWTATAAGDLLYRGLTTPETVFHWHGETFDLPPGAELLASSAACRHQAYRVHPNIYGLQFHLEVTPEMIAEWLDQDALCGDLREVRTSIDPHVNAARLRELAALVFGRWCDLVSPC
jgi:GMP synthase-like glutamine amidotransferase